MDTLTRSIADQLQFQAHNCLVGIVLFGVATVALWALYCFTLRPDGAPRPRRSFRGLLGTIVPLLGTAALLLVLVCTASYIISRNQVADAAGIASKVRAAFADKGYHVTSISSDTNHKQILHVHFGKTDQFFAGHPVLSEPETHVAVDRAALVQELRATGIDVAADSLAAQ